MPDDRSRLGMSPVVRTRIFHRIYLSAFGAVYEDIGD